jgi:homoserine acetyltransferase
MKKVVGNPSMDLFIGILAYSIGAAAAVKAVADRDTVESMVPISCPSSFEAIDYHFRDSRALL